MKMDLRTINDTFHLVQLVDTLYPDVMDGRAGGVVANVFGSGTAYQLYAKSGVVPPWMWIDTGDTIYVIVTGITSLQDAVNLLSAASLPLKQQATWFANVMVLSASLSIFNVVSGLFGSRSVNWRLFGHSYGGAIVQPLAAVLNDAFPSLDLQVACTGAPRPGDSSLAARLSLLTVRRYMNDTDPIPRFPPSLTEAPAASLAVGLVVASLWSSYAQGPGGIVFDQTGNISARSLPPLVLPIADVNLASWAVGFNGFQSAAHSVRSYLLRMSLFLQAQSGAVPVVTSSLGPEALTLLTPAAFAALSAAFAAVTSSSGTPGATMPAYIPVQYRAKMVKVGTSYKVSWMGLLVAIGVNKSNAKSITKYLNAFLRRLQTASSADHTNMGNALQAYLVVAASPTAGFLPTLTVT